MSVTPVVGVPQRQRCTEPGCGQWLRPRIGKKQSNGLYAMRWEHMKPCGAKTAKVTAESASTVEPTNLLDGARWRRRIEGAL